MSYMHMLSVPGHTLMDELHHLKCGGGCISCLFSFACSVAQNLAHMQISKRDSAHLHAQLPLRGFFCKFLSHSSLKETSHFFFSCLFSDAEPGLCTE